MEGHCSTGQSPKWAVVPTEEEDKRNLPALADEAGLRENIVLTGNLTYDTDGRVLIHSTVNSRRHHLYGPQLVVTVILTNFMARNKQTYVTKPFFVYPIILSQST